jgi:DNA-binding response OmpR family regulator
MPGREVPLVVIASAADSMADQLATRLRRGGAVVYVTHSAGGCLRVATSVGPDLVLLDPAMPKRLEKLLRAHPTSSRAQVLRLSAGVLADLSHATSVPLAAA